MWLAGVSTGSSVTAAAPSRKVALADRKNQGFISVFESWITGSVKSNKLKCACAISKLSRTDGCFIQRYQKSNKRLCMSA
jgi:hypothetical protein